MALENLKTAYNNISKNISNSGKRELEAGLSADQQVQETQNLLRGRAAEKSFKDLTQLSISDIANPFLGGLEYSDRAKIGASFGNLGDKEFDNALKGEVQEFNVQKTKYIQGVVKDVNINAAQAKNKIHTAPTITGNLTEAQKRQRANEQIRAKIMDGTYKAGDLINYGNNEYRIVTDTGLL